MVDIIRLLDFTPDMSKVMGDLVSVYEGQSKINNLA